jgi:hypothetical protein
MKPRGLRKNVGLVIMVILQTHSSIFDQHERPSSQLLCSNCERIPQRAILVSQSDSATGDLEIFAGYYAILMANNRFCIDSQCPSLLSLGGDAALDAVLEWIRPEVSRLVGFRRQSRRSFFFRSGLSQCRLHGR